MTICSPPSATLLLSAAAIPLLTGAELRVVPTFENCSLYLDGAPMPAAACGVRYRERGSADWRTGHPLVGSADDRGSRGSLFGLRPGTAYEVACQDQSGQLVASASFLTWNEQVPVARTIHLGGGTPGPLRIGQGGTADGWIRYTAEPGQVVDGGEADDDAILVQEASFIILDGLTVRGGRLNGIRLTNCHDVRIAGCDIAGFGRAGTQDRAKGGKYVDEQGRTINNDAGVSIDGSRRVVVERTWIHDARGHANSWHYSHPAGPDAMVVRSAGELVLRWNDCTGSEEHRWQDAIKGWGNDQPDGGPNRDSDIHGNLLALGNDDGVELDGPQCNVRCYGNLIMSSLCGISTAPNLRGPSWVFANLVTGLGDERGMAGAAFKNGGGRTWSRGTTFFYHNTCFGLGSGIAGVGFGKDDDRDRFDGVGRGNLFALASAGVLDPHALAGAYDGNLFATPWGIAGTCEPAAAAGPQALFHPARLLAPEAGDCRPAAGSPACGAGSPIPGFRFLQGDGAIGLGALPAADRPARSLPWRPGAPTAEPREIHVHGPGADAVPVEVRIATPAASAQSFTVCIPSHERWLLAEPRSGLLVPGVPLALRIRVDAQALPRGGSATGTVLVRSGSGMGVPVVVRADLGPADPGIQAEAEGLAGADGFTLREDDGASGGRFLDFQGDRVLRGSGLDLPFTIAREGWYALALRVRCPSPLGSHDSIFLGLDGAEPTAMPFAGGAGWMWANGTGPHGPRILLTAGRHRLRLAPRESLDLDAVRLLGCPLPLSAQGAASSNRTSTP